MASEQLGYLDFLKAAFHRRRRLPLLGAMPLNQLGLAVFAVLGIANPGFWFLGAAAELAYLLGMSSSKRFQNLVRAERMLAAKETWEAKLGRAVDRLVPDAQARYRRLLDQCRQALGIAETLDGDSLGSLRKLRTGGLNQMLWIFLRLLTSRQVLEQNLSHIDRDGLEQEVRGLEQRLADAEAGSALGRSLEGTLEIQRKRLENLARAEQSLAVVDAELERIEHQVVLIREESAVSGKAEILSSRLDAVSGALAETNRWMEQNANIFGELGADPLGSAPADLPAALPAVEQEG